MGQAAEDCTAICWAVAAPEGDQTLFTGSSDSTARKWCTQTGEQLMKFSGHTGVTLSVCLTVPVSVLVSVSHILAFSVSHSLELL